MEQVFPLYDENSRHRRKHSRHLSNISLGTISIQSFSLEDEAEEALPRPGHTRKASFQEIPSNLAWATFGDTAEAENEDENEDDREDVRDQHLSEEFHRERLQTEEDVPLQFPAEEGHEVVEVLAFEQDHHQFPRVHQAANPSQAPCFRDVAETCPDMMPTMPTMDDLFDTSERVELILRRTRAFSEDASMDFSGSSVRSLVRRARSYARKESSSSSLTGRSIRRYGRADSMLIDSQYADIENAQQSPASTWVYWEEHLESAKPSSPFASAFLPREEQEEHA